MSNPDLRHPYWTCERVNTGMVQVGGGRVDVHHLHRVLAEKAAQERSPLRGCSIILPGENHS